MPSTDFKGKQHDYLLTDVLLGSVATKTKVRREITQAPI